jgi:hypothetical protein
VIKYNQDQHVPQYCDGTDWRAMGPFPGAGGTACTGPTRPEGVLLYNFDHSVMQYCDGSEWVAMWPYDSSDDVLDGLVGWWKLDDGAGSTTAADSSGGGHDGVLTNMDANTDWVAGINGGALEFDGNDQYVSLNAPGGTLSGLGCTVSLCTISAWIKMDGNGGGGGSPWDQQTIVADRTDGYYGIHANNTGPQVHFYHWDGNEDTISYPLALDQWYHVVWMHAHGRLRAYVNGVQVGDMASGNTGADTEPFIGGDPDQNADFSGLIDDVRVYARALSAEEIKKVYLATQPIDLKNDLVGHWKLDDGTGSASAADASGNGHTGTLTNMDPNAGWVPGRTGGALEFDGTDDYVETTSFSTPNRILTMSAWIKPNTVTGTQTVIQYQNHLMQLNGDKVNVFWTGGINHNTASNLASGHWYHIVGIIDGANDLVSIYRNGILALQESDAFLNNNSVSGTLRVGEDFNGQIDDVRLYNRILTAEEIQKLATPPPDLEHGLVGHWPFEDGAGSTAADASGSGHDGALTNMDPNTDWVTGQIGGALDFDGSNEYVNVNSFSINANAPWTMGGWVRLNNTHSHGLVSWRRNASGINQAFTGVNPSNLGVANRFGAAMWDGASWTVVNDTTDAQTHTWTHVMAVYDGGALRLYVDGREVGSSAQTTGMAGAPDTMKIGQDHHTSQTINGLIDDVRVYDRALTGEEIRQLAALPVDLDSGLVGHWQMEDGTGSATAADSSGSANTGTLTNMTPASDWVTGRVGNGALEFDGSDDYVAISTLNALFENTLDQQGTITAWFQSDDWGSGSDYPSVFTVRADGNNLIYLRKHPSYGFEYLHHAGGTVRRISKPINEVPTRAQWHFIALAWDKPGDSVTAYFNASPVGSTAGPGTKNWNFGTFTPMIGANTEENGGAGIGYFDGQIDDVRIYGRALNEDEIKALASVCNNPGLPESAMLYNTDHSVMQYCNGQDWVAIGK